MNNLKEGELAKLYSVNTLLEADMATIVYSFVYKQLLLQNKEKPTKETFESKIKSIIVTEKLINKTIMYIKASEKSKNPNVKLNNDFESKIILYAGLIYLTIYESDNQDLNKKGFKLMHLYNLISEELEIKLLDLVMQTIQISNLYDICTMIENETYKGYFNYMNIEKN